MKLGEPNGQIEDVAAESYAAGLGLEATLLMSIAISAKRLADALDFGDDDQNLAEAIVEIARNTRKS